MIRQNVRINVLSGIHFRPAEELTKLTMRYKSDVFMLKGDSKVSMKSFLSMLGAGLKYGDEVCIECDGEDENDAIKAITEFFEKE